MCLATVCLHGPHLCVRANSPRYTAACFRVGAFVFAVRPPARLIFLWLLGAGREAHVRGGEGGGRGNMREQLEGKGNSGDHGFTKFLNEI